VQVVEHEEHPLGSRRGLEQRGDRLEQGVALGFGVGAHGSAQRVELGQQPREVGREVAELGAQAIQPDRRCGGAQRLDPRLVGHREALVAAPVEHERPLAVHGARQFGGEPCLADARLTGDDRSMRSGDCLGPQLAHASELSIAADQRKLGRDV
jgi:hypothetical protein